MTKRKVRKDFDRTQPIKVDVTRSSNWEKEKVQQAFFDIGIFWGCMLKEYKKLCANAYGNFIHDCGAVTLKSLSSGGELSPEEFFDMVYEVEDKEMEGYTKVDDLNKFLWMLKDTSKEVYIEFIKRDVRVEPYWDWEGSHFCHNLWGCVVSADIHALPKYDEELYKEVFFIDGEFYTKNSAIEFNYEEYCKGGYVAKIRSGLEVTQIKKFDIEGVFPIAGVVGGHTIQTWTGGGSNGATNYKTDADLVMYKV